MFDAQALRGFINELTVDTTQMNAAQAVATMARVAEGEKQRVIGTARARSGGIPPGYRQIVDGVVGAPFTQVKPEGLIILAWSYLGEVAQATMDALVVRSPRESGGYIQGLQMAVNGTQVKSPRWQDLGPNVTEITIAATVPYARRLEVGHAEHRTWFVEQVGPHIVLETMIAMRSLYGSIAEFSFDLSPPTITIKPRQVG